MKSAKSLGMTLLGVWLILSSVLPYMRVGIPGIGMLLNLLALAAGILILVGR